MILFKYVVLAFISLCLFSCKQPEPYVTKKPLVTSYTIPIQSNQSVQNLPAVVKASRLTALSFRVNGELINIAVQSGEKVKKGQLLARLDPTDYQLTVNDKESKMVLAQNSKERAAKMVKVGNMAQSVLDALDARYRILKAEYEYALLQLSYVELRAPFEGVIASVPADNFQNTAVGQTVISMHSKDMVEIQVSLPDLLLSSAQEHTNKSSYLFDVSLDAYPGYIFKAKYKEHTTEQTTENKKYVLILEMPIDKNRTTLQGMPGNIQLDLAKLKMKKMPVYKVPVESVILPDDKNNKTSDRVVWRILPNNTVEPVNIKIQGLATLAVMNVSGELNEGDKIVTQGMSYLTQGMNVITKAKGGKVQ